MRLYYIANARMPNEKAHGIQIAKVCEAFIDEGVDLVLVIPSRTTIAGSVKDFYGLRHDIPTVTLPALDLYNRGKMWYTLSTVSFAISYFFYLLTHMKKGDIIYAADFDQLFYAVMPLLSHPYFCEMHGAKPPTFINRVFFKKAAGIIPTNSLTKEQLKKVFRIPEERLIVEPNGVDFSQFKPVSLEEARQELGLSHDMKLALYVGRFLSWKGLEVLPHTASLVPSNITVALVGGSEEEFSQVTGENPGALRIFGAQPYSAMPLWVSAADALIVLGTKKDEYSYNFTSPMKIFEYMAMKRPIVASETPAIKNILETSECYFHEPDDAKSLARAIATAVEDPKASEKTSRAFEKVKKHSWDERTKRIIQFVNRRVAV